MENICEVDQMELPPGFRFHPTDEELITHYLYPKFCNTNFVATAIGEVDLNQVEPWDLPWRAKMGEKEWYFFCVRDRKYPTGLRTNRATEAGYWKATGKDKEIYRSKKLVGMKKTLVFYKGRAPKGEKSNWVMHEFRVDGMYCITNPPKTTKNEWVISRIFHKSSGGKKMHISGLVRHGNFGDQFHNHLDLPALLDVTVPETSHVSCFSQELGDSQTDEQMLSPSRSSILSPKLANVGSLFSTQHSLQLPESLLMQEASFLRFLQGESGPETETKQSHITDFSQETGVISTDISSNHEMGQSTCEEHEYTIASAGPVDLDCLWNY